MFYRLSFDLSYDVDQLRNYYLGAYEEIIYKLFKVYTDWP